MFRGIKPLTFFFRKNAFHVETHSKNALASKHFYLYYKIGKVIFLELNLIGKEKLEILLTRADMDDFNISNENLDYKNTETRRAVWDILDKAKKKTGFDAASGKIRIDALPSKSGGCVIFITKTEHPFTTEEKMNCPKDNLPETFEKTFMTIYGFSSISELLNVCRFLSLRGYVGESTVYTEKKESHVKNRYYLMLSDKISYKTKPSCSIFENMFIGEFGTRLSDENMFLYIKEHCDLICGKNAVKILSAIA